ncbi:MAG: alkaline phosphatase D family protein [Gammaproteobacteria bacterium]
MFFLNRMLKKLGHGRSPRGYRSVSQATAAFVALGLALSQNSFARTDAGYSQSGDVTATSAVIWGRCNSERDAYFVVDVSTSTPLDKRFELLDAEGLEEKLGPLVSIVNAETDYTDSIVARGLRPDTRYFYRTLCVTRPAKGLVTAELGGVGQFHTAPTAEQASPVRFVWAADLGGQGWGRNPNLQVTTVDGQTIRGGYVIFKVMNQLQPDFAIFQGDMIYADNAISTEQEIPAELGGGVWVNDPAKDFVAITLDEFRANWKYNLGDEKLGGFLQCTPVYAQWDDHEVTNNWYPGEILIAEPYNSLSADIVAERAKQAFFEYNPISGGRIFRKFQHGKHLEVFLLDERSFRGPNPANSEPTGIEMLGQEQLEWLKRSLRDSQATWKVISTHDPLSIVTGGEGDRDAWAQGEADVLGREVQLSHLLEFLKDEGIKNVVYLTSDVHYVAAISYNPERAVFKNFDAFWEFVIGPVHAGAFGPGELDLTFGPNYEFLRAPGDADNQLPQNSPPPQPSMRTRLSSPCGLSWFL